MCRGDKETIRRRYFSFYLSFSLSVNFSISFLFLRAPEVSHFSPGAEGAIQSGFQRPAGVGFRRGLRPRAPARQSNARARVALTPAPAKEYAETPDSFSDQ